MVMPALAVFAAVPAQAQSNDPRIQLAPYSPGAVYILSVLNGFASVVEFAAGETVDSVVVGDSSAWQITLTGAGDRVIVKPLSGAAPTNMVVVTSLRRYVIFLNSTGSPQDLYVLKFTYDAQESGAAQVAQEAAEYRFRGAKRLRPTAMTDNGRDTTITWADQTPIPALYAFDDDGQEMILNGRMVAGRFIVEGVHPKLVFRLGRDQLVAQRVLRKPRK